VVEALTASGDLDGEPKATQRKANFYERGDKPLEIVTSRQWYIRNGGRDADLRDALIERGQQIEFHPEFMRVRYENWVGGLNGDWLISRQRFFGIPIPLWYPIDEHGEPVYDSPIVPPISSLPIDPSAQAPEGYTEDQRGQAGGFVGDPDVMDTWATSSLTPQLTTGWGEYEGDAELFGKLFPMDLRPQGQDIIRTWLFSTAVRAHHLQDQIPWKHAAISGWILDPDRKKMSKSKGNAETPEGMLDLHGSDAVRYWAASARLGTDAAFDTGQMKVGRRLAMKVLNASKFVLGFPEPTVAEDDACGAENCTHGLLNLVTEPIDRAMLTGLARVVEQATAGYENYDHTRALEVAETFFWTFCDDYLELVKARAYGDESVETPDAATTSARAALRVALDVLLRLLAPVLPFATEEVWSWWRAGSVHRSPWPETSECLPAEAGDSVMLDAVGQALGGVRRAKSDAKVGMRASVSSMTLAGPATALDHVRAAEGDLRASGRIEGEISYVDGEHVEVRDAELIPPPPKN